MPTHAEQRYVPYRPDQMFDLVAEVDKYPEFLPWCRAARIVHREGNLFYADLVVAFRMFRERFRSKVLLLPKYGIDVEYIDGPFKYLNNHWRFKQATDGGCIIDFYVDFEFRSRLLQTLMELLFNEAVQRMVRAFEARARSLYGDGVRERPQGEMGGPTGEPLTMGAD